MKDLAKQLEKEAMKEVKKIEKSFTKEFNKWINQFADKHEIDSGKLEVSQNNKNRFAEVLHEGKMVAYVNINNDILKFHELI
ncbi:MAG: hypothetical protein CL670_12440 [Balneola sp.]|jgi:mRNA-degrading endonuclease RelE of RelBE toxin-antitoxin system|nr:hypothetical protein [Balneola sp.]MBE79956.1 hypothetical protein [Balneola sp.]|tara:strand:+ start:596 stop:841 length:246 start_codon:yes stop_codon:yes gene_type:complete